MKQKKISLTLVLVVIFATLLVGQSPTVGTSVQGDFDGDGIKEFAFAVKIKEGKGNPVDGGTADEYSINFSTTKLKSIKVGCCNTRLINEADLNGDGRDEITVYQAPMNGNTYSMTTYTFANGAWKVLIETFLIPTGGDYLSDEDLQKRIFKEDGYVYYYDVDVNDENFKLIKTKKDTCMVFIESIACDEHFCCIRPMKY